MEPIDCGVPAATRAARATSAPAARMMCPVFSCGQQGGGVAKGGLRTGRRTLQALQRGAGGAQGRQASVRGGGVRWTWLQKQSGPAEASGGAPAERARASRDPRISGIPIAYGDASSLRQAAGVHADRGAYSRRICHHELIAAGGPPTQFSPATDDALSRHSSRDEIVVQWPSGPRRASRSGSCF